MMRQDHTDDLRREEQTYLFLGLDPVNTVQGVFRR